MIPIALLERLKAYKGVIWDEYQKDTELTPATLQDGQVVSSQRKDGFGHMLILDVDFPVHVVESSTPGHSHVYFDSPAPINQDAFDALLIALANAGIIETGYAAVSKGRKFTALRLPWVKKEPKPPVVLLDLDDIDEIF